MVATIATVEALGRETTTSTMAALAAKKVEAATTLELPVAVRTVTVEEMVIWVGRFRLFGAVDGGYGQPRH